MSESGNAINIDIKETCDCNKILGLMLQLPTLSDFFEIFSLSVGISFQCVVSYPSHNGNK